MQETMMTLLKKQTTNLPFQCNRITLILETDTTIINIHENFVKHFIVHIKIISFAILSLISLSIKLRAFLPLFY